jgi:2-dehydro-3-deoxyphosphogluconate aldolase/(4S)-4-hydroxy-2-oxoglutarate aldolase
MSNVLEVVAAGRLMPVVVVRDPAHAEPLGAALLAGGLRTAEVTFRTDAAAEAIRRMAQDERLVVGAGTVLTREQVDQAVAAGARYVVTPGFSVKVVEHCAQVGVPVFPGVATATEVQMALDAGLSTVKFFPAEQLGGVAMLKALTAPYGKVRFIPTGGISAANLADYLALPAVYAAGGSWMVAPDLLAAGAFDEIERLTADAVALALAAASAA